MENNSTQQYYWNFYAADNTLSIYFLFCGIINAENLTMDDYAVIASNVKDRIKPPSQESFNELSSSIQDIRLKRDHAPAITSSIIDIIGNTVCKESFLSELILLFEKKELDKIKKIVRNIINQVDRKGNFDIQVKFSQYTAPKKSEESIPKIENSSENKNENKKGNDFNPFIPSGSLLVRFKFVLSPVSGLSLTELKPHTNVMIQLDPSDPSSNNVIELKKLRRKDGTVKSTEAEIINIENKDKGSEVVVRLGEGTSIYGVILEEEKSIKIRLADNSEVEKRNKNNKNTGPKNSSEELNLMRGGTSTLTLILGLALVLIGIIAVILFL